MNKIAFAALPLALLAGNAYGNFYVNLGGGVAFPSKNSSFTDTSSSVVFAPTVPGTSIFTLPNVNWHNKYKTGFNLNAALGYQPCETPWRADLEFLYQHFNRHTSGTYGWLEQHTNGVIFAQTSNNPIVVKSSGVNVYSFLANGYYEFCPLQTFTPLLGIGAGIAWLHSDSKTGFTILDARPISGTAPILQRSPSLSGTAFALQLKAGVAYELCSDMALVLQYRLFGTTKFTANQSSFTTNDGIPQFVANFYVPKRKISGVITNGIELVLKFKL